MAQQTAVEWLEEQLPIRIVNSFNEEINRAKEMEKEQIMDAYRQGCYDYILHEEGDIIRSEEYYNETYAKCQDNADKDDIK